MAATFAPTPSLSAGEPSPSSSTGGGEARAAPITASRFAQRRLRVVTEPKHSNKMHRTRTLSELILLSPRSSPRITPRHKRFDMDIEVSSFFAEGEGLVDLMGSSRNLRRLSERHSTIDEETAAPIASRNRFFPTSNEAGNQHEEMDVDEGQPEPEAEPEETQHSVGEVVDMLFEIHSALKSRHLGQRTAASALAASNLVSTLAYPAPEPIPRDEQLEALENTRKMLECAICQEVFTNATEATCCGQIFCKDCIERWFGRPLPSWHVSSWAHHPAGAHDAVLHPHTWWRQLRLYTQDTDTLLCTAVRRRQYDMSVSFIISLATNLDTTSNQTSEDGTYPMNAPLPVARLDKNYMGSQYTMYDTTGEVPVELGAVQYAATFGKSPRQMRVALPLVAPVQNVDSAVDGAPSWAVQPWRPETKEDTILSQVENPDTARALHLINKPPVWIESLEAYCLDFGGRVAAASVKNFLLSHPDDMDKTLMLFGRTQDRQVYSMDYAHPFTPVQPLRLLLAAWTRTS
ncbi:Tubby C-terminal-like domain [Phytophthora cactorum]|nr:Tubby C-terminal-like domain [Phytophthora cactorum]